MAVMTSATELREERKLQLQKTRSTCLTRRRRLWKIGGVYGLIAVLGILAAFWAYRYFQPMALTHPDFEPAAQTGVPQVEAQYGYSTLTVDETYQVRLCGVPANDGQNVDFYLTNPEESGVWFRAEILDEGGEIIASTGVLRPGEYLKTISLNQPLTAHETPVTVRSVAYEPDTWQSRGNINLNMTLYLDET